MTFHFSWLHQLIILNLLGSTNQYCQESYPKIKNYLSFRGLVLSKDLTFYNVLAEMGASFCNEARLNFQAFALRNIKVEQNMT